MNQRTESARGSTQAVRCRGRQLQRGALRAAIEPVAAAWGVNLDVADVGLDERLGGGLSASGHVRIADTDHVTDLVGTRADV